MTWSGELSVESEDDPVTFPVRIVKVDPGNLHQTSCSLQYAHCQLKRPRRGYVLHEEVRKNGGRKVEIDAKQMGLAEV